MKDLIEFELPAVELVVDFPFVFLVDIHVDYLQFELV